ncbi:dGTPase [Peptoniphilus asaccharolyticus DSM 20463]|uniref:Deoxyguanosinetriphosphate triphosphohydrolase-like protein n=1 Tax=Peptoniphilus asaccharolyticus DSM 20463 TaxID=573058 RepID=A0A1W1UTR2_PEPAS|nr:deoxyguanosinetriphosphate triphosphohydrolase [Peptoniphilus asaccharolyticus]MBL7575177.1 deoxyguanosinetriphosphate triphosphohydrolase [Peptoniphilus asaccharolyticus]SMB84492.1 dGTPase [Peptoniphilus asaccharolyticus DSM 20463]
MIPRKRREELEHVILYKIATFSDQSKGRLVPEEDCDMRTCFQRDRDRILHSKAFRRLKHKTQVFISPEGDHFRTRLTHTLEVAQIARTIGRLLELNEDLIEAMALGHDLGHTPFGHSGETILNRLHPNGFKHNEQSIRVVEFLATTENRVGLNLTYEVKDGILNHSGEGQAQTLEGKIIKYADRIAYINHDIDDAIRAGIIKERDLPSELTEILGSGHSKRIDTMITSIYKNSYHKDFVKMEPDIERATLELRQYMFKNVYYDKTVKSENEKIYHIIESLFNYYMEDLKRIPEAHLNLYKDREHIDEDVVSDYIAGMTDIYVVEIYKKLFIPKGWANELYNR